MKEVYVKTRAAWRKWLEKHHDREPDGIWLVYYKKETGKPSLNYGESVEEALCYGWIDSIIRKLDDERYCRKFTPRKDDSQWSSSNKKRVTKLIAEGLMTEVGLAKITVAKESGRWDEDPTPTVSLDMPPELAKALNQDKQAKQFFESLSPTYQKQFLGWINSAKRDATRAKRIAESAELLAAGKKLGLR